MFYCICSGSRQLPENNAAFSVNHNHLYIQSLSSENVEDYYLKTEYFNKPTRIIFFSQDFVILIK